jgi:hypothetical protein
MKKPSPTSVACCAALLSVTVPLMARSESKTLVLVDAEPQYASKLCWAAADLLAVNQFYPSCPATTTTAEPATLYPTSQATEAADHMSTSVGGHPSSYFLSNVCGPQIGLCNDWSFPLLHGLKSKKGSEFPNPQSPDPMGLDWDTMREEIKAGRPVLFMWDYPSNDTDASSPVGKHALVVIGYSDDTGFQQLQVWDPWPVPDELVSQVPACGPASGVQGSQDHSQWIDFTTYRDPTSDMGVTAVHDQDQWGLAKIETVVPEPPVLTVDGVSAPSPPTPRSHKHSQPPSVGVPQSFAKALSMALPQGRKLGLQVSGGPPRSLGVPFPIVGLGFVQLLRAANEPTRLLAGTTSAILFPVQSEGKVVDAFLMLFKDGRWQRGGYANIEITRRLVGVRATYAARQHLSLDQFYMVSVPGEVAFFAAYGRGRNAILIPASTDPTIEARAGVPVPADKQLRKLVQVIQGDLQRTSGGGRDTSRPGR